jgi:hypothetical protein
MRRLILVRYASLTTPYSQLLFRRISRLLNLRLLGLRLLGLRLL